MQGTLSRLSQGITTGKKQQAIMNVREQIDDAQKDLISLRQQTVAMLRNTIDKLPIVEKENDDISN